jgi:ParB family chromosome partitioning protein
MLSEGLIEKGHAKLLASLSPEQAEIAAKRIVKDKMSVKDLSSLTSKKKPNKTNKSKIKNTDILNIEREMSDSFGHKVEIETKNKKSGKVSITYNTLDELDNIISKIKK